MALQNKNDDFLITNPSAQPNVVDKVEAGLKPVQLLEPYQAGSDVHSASSDNFTRMDTLRYCQMAAVLYAATSAAVEYFDKATVNSLDLKRDRLARVRIKREQADAICATAARILPIIDNDVVPNEWAAGGGDG